MAEPKKTMTRSQMNSVLGAVSREANTGVKQKIPTRVDSNANRNVTNPSRSLQADVEITGAGRGLDALLGNKTRREINRNTR